MSPQDVDRVLAEWDTARDRSLSPELQAIETALFLEDTFGIDVPEESIHPGPLGTVDGMRAVLAHHQRDR